LARAGFAVVEALNLREWLSVVEGELSRGRFGDLEMELGE
jgi:hypothetical protein